MFARMFRRSTVNRATRNRKQRLAVEALEGRQLMSLGAQFGPINSTNHLGVSASANATSANGSSVVAWTYEVTPTQHDIVAQRLNGTGGKVGPQMVVSSGPDDENDASVAIDNQGDFVVTWMQTEPNGNTDILARKYGPSGNALGSIVPVAVGTFPQTDAHVAMDAAGDFVVAYTRYTNNDNYNVFAKLYNVNEKLVNVVSVATNPSIQQYNSSVAMTPDGRFYVAYQFYASGTDAGINMNEYSAQGGLLEAGTITTEVSAGNPTVSVDNLGNAVVAWGAESSSESEILARRVSYLGGMGPVLTIAASRDFDLGNQAVAMKRDGSGAFVVAYESDIPIFIKGRDLQMGNEVLVAEVSPSPSNQITTLSVGNVSQRRSASTTPASIF